MEAVDLLAQIEGILLASLPGFEVLKHELDLSTQLTLVRELGKFSKTPAELFALHVETDLNGRL